MKKKKWTEIEFLSDKWIVSREKSSGASTL